MSEPSTPRSYFDYNASAPMSSEVRAGVERALDHPGNPSSVHTEGRRAHAMIEAARRDVAALAGVETDRVIFTSGGSEANMTALVPANCGHDEPNAADGACLISSVEHPSVLEGGRFDQAQVRQIGVDANGVIDVSELTRELSKSASLDTVPPLVSVMAANNETGVLQPIGEIAEIVHEAGGVLHSDMVQVAGRVPLEVDRLGVDMASLSAHKIGGPQGLRRAGSGKAFEGPRPSSHHRRRPGTPAPCGNRECARNRRLRDCRASRAGHAAECWKSRRIAGFFGARNPRNRAKRGDLCRGRRAVAQHDLFCGRRHVGRNPRHRIRLGGHRGERRCGLFVGQGRAFACSRRDGRSGRSGAGCRSGQSGARQRPG